MSEIKPYTPDEAKKEQVETMFDNIAGKYDTLNHLFTLGIDKGWRKKMIQKLAPLDPKRVLDVATGTGDVAIRIGKMLRPTQVIGIDLSKGMLELGKEKVNQAGLQDIISLEQGDSENLRFDTDYFDAVTVAFGVRNFENLDKGLTEMLRVIRPGGQAVILEFSMPTNFLFRSLYIFYSKYIMPFIGRVLSGDKRAYTYLFESVQHFPHGKTFIDRLHKLGFKNATATPLFLGICTIYNGYK